MKNSYFSLAFLFFGLVSMAQTINFTDSNFKAVLLFSNTTNTVAKNSSGTNIKIDINNDGEIQLSEALNVFQLNVTTNSMPDITSMDGIQYFTNLTYLNCNNNAFTSLDLTALTHLEFLQSCNGALTSLNVSGLNSLERIYCYSNAITSLTLTGLTNLAWLWCDNNSITTLDFNGLSSLRYVQCRSNQLTSISNTANLGIIEFHCTDNHLTSLDLTGLTLLSYLDCSSNNISSINIQPALNSLQILYCSANPITNLNIAGSSVGVLGVSNTLLTSIDCSQSGVTQLFATDCPNLQTINVRNGVMSYSDPDMLYFGFRIYNNPSLVSICTDDNEQNQLAYFPYNTSGSVIVYNGANCDIPAQVNMGINDLNKAAVKLYPNPSMGIVNIEVSDNQTINKVAVSNVLGQTIMVLGNTATLDISSLNKGTYFITVETDNGRQTQKIIKL